MQMRKNANRSRNPDERRSHAVNDDPTHFTSVADLPGVGTDLVSATMVKGGAVICGWREARSCWHMRDAGVSMVGVLRSPEGDLEVIVVNVASSVDVAMLDMLPPEHRTRIVAESIRIGVRPKVIADDNRDSPTSCVIHPGLSDKKRRFDKSERNQGGKFAGKPMIVFKPKEFNLEGFTSFAKLFQNNWHDQLELLGEQTPHMQKQGLVRVSRHQLPCYSDLQETVRRHAHFSNVALLFDQSLDVQQQCDSSTGCGYCEEE